MMEKMSQPLMSLDHWQYQIHLSPAEVVWHEHFTVVTLIY